MYDGKSRTSIIQLAWCSATQLSPQIPCCMLYVMLNCHFNPPCTKFHSYRLNCILLQKCFQIFCQKSFLLENFGFFEAGNFHRIFSALNEGLATVYVRREFPWCSLLDSLLDYRPSVHPHNAKKGWISSDHTNLGILKKNKIQTKWTVYWEKNPVEEKCSHWPSVLKGYIWTHTDNILTLLTELQGHDWNVHLMKCE